jgi:phosphatidylinositol alpha-mannosyltransferase
MDVLLEALRGVPPSGGPGVVRLLVAGRGDADWLRRRAGQELADRIDVLGAVSDDAKAAALRSMDVYCAPNLGGESFGMVLTEAMAAGVPVLASDLDAFRRVLDGGRAGELVPPGDPVALAVAGRERAGRYAWPVVAASVLQVYEAAIAADPRRLVVRDSDDELPVDPMIDARID